MTNVGLWVFRIWLDMLSFEGVEDTTLALLDEEDQHHNPGFNHWGHFSVTKQQGKRERSREAEKFEL